MLEAGWRWENLDYEMRNEIWVVGVMSNEMWVMGLILIKQIWNLVSFWFVDPPEALNTDDQALKYQNIVFVEKKWPAGGTEHRQPMLEMTKIYNLMRNEIWVHNENEIVGIRIRMRLWVWSI